jgi:hypothetical protein
MRLAASYTKAKRVCGVCVDEDLKFSLIGIYSMRIAKSSLCLHVYSYKGKCTQYARNCWWCQQPYYRSEELGCNNEYCVGFLACDV